ncbi:MAG: PilT/PilU family type 4a pilus ATPase [Halioglobus sp.]|nr:PilT/PilU family type 4a pilus ATPase [Halioglobus sp.]
MKIIEWLKILSAEGGSDLYLSTGAPPCVKFEGELRPIASGIMQPGEVEQIVYEVMDKVQQSEFEKNLELNLALPVSGYGRFRINAFMQRGEVGVVARNMVSDIPRWQDLRLPHILTDIILQRTGLVLLAGATGAGIGASLASLVDYRNSNSSGHIVTIEDPVEYVHNHKKSIVNQREVGVDTRSWHNALNNTLRQAPDVVVLGEIRDAETLQYAMDFAGAGRLCIATLHANSAEQALQQIMALFPDDKRSQSMVDLSRLLQCVVCQQLMTTSTGARYNLHEVLLCSDEVSQRLVAGEINGMQAIMEKSESHGMQTFDASLVDLYEERRIDEEEALRCAQSEDTVRLKIRLAGQEQDLGRRAFVDFNLEEVDEGEFGPL